MKEKDSWKIGTKTMSEITKQDEQFRTCAKCPAMDKMFTDRAFYTKEIREMIIGHIVKEGCPHKFALSKCPSDLVKADFLAKLKNIGAFPGARDYTYDEAFMGALRNAGIQAETYRQRKSALQPVDKQKRALNEDIQSLINYIKKNF